MLDFLYLAEKIKRFEDSQWGTKRDMVSDNFGYNTGGKNLNSRGGGRLNSVSKRNSMLNQDNVHPVTGMEIDPHLDFRALGKNTKCNIDHSKYHCILPYTSVKQPSLKLNYVKLIND